MKSKIKLAKQICLSCGDYGPVNDKNRCATCADIEHLHRQLRETASALSASVSAQQHAEARILELTAERDEPAILGLCGNCNRHARESIEARNESNRECLFQLLEMSSDGRYLKGLLQAAISFGVVNNYEWEELTREHVRRR